MWAECERAKARASVHLRSERLSMFKRKVLRRWKKRRCWGGVGWREWSGEVGGWSWGGRWELGRFGCCLGM
jgi:hypothetical protein